METIKINGVDRKIITYEHENRAWERPDNRLLRIVLDKGESIAIAAHKSESCLACVDQIPDEIADLTKKEMCQVSVKLNARPGIPRFKNPEEGYPVDPARSKWAVYRDRPGNIFRALIHFESMPHSKSDLATIGHHPNNIPKMMRHKIAPIIQTDAQYKKLFVNNTITSFVRATKETTCEPGNTGGELICYYTWLFDLNTNWRLKVAVQNGFHRNQSNYFVADDYTDFGDIKIFSCYKENKLMITATVIINNVKFPAKAEFIPLEQNELDDLIKNDTRVSLEEYYKANLDNPHLQSIFEHVRNIDPVIIELKAKNAALQSAFDMISKKGDHELITQAAAGIRRDSLVVSPGNMPGPIGDALRALDLDARQIINLRLQLDEKGKLLTWRRIAELFRREGKGHKKYTDERCRQIYEKAVKQHPDIEQYVLALSKRHKLNFSKRPKTDEQADKEEIENIFSNQKFDLADLGDAEGNHNAGYRVTKYPRKPI